MAIPLSPLTQNKNALINCCYLLYGVEAMHIMKKEQTFNKIISLIYDISNRKKQKVTKIFKLKFL